MKQIYIEKQAKDQVHKNFRNTNSEVHCLLIRVQPNSDFLNIFLIQNKGKGPPGDILHPDHPPDGEVGPPDINPVRFQKSVRIEICGDKILKICQSIELILNKKDQLFNKKQISNFYKH